MIASPEQETCAYAMLPGAANASEEKRKIPSQTDTAERKRRERDIEKWSLVIFNFQEYINNFLFVKFILKEIF